MNRPKAQGTQWETDLVKQATIWGLDARRLAEGGSTDEGDLEIIAGHRWIIEAKARERLNVTRTLADARSKSPEPGRTALAWKRLVPKQNGKRRGPDGERSVIVLPTDTFMAMLFNEKFAEGAEWTWVGVSGN